MVAQVWLEFAPQHAERRRFAYAVRAEQSQLGASSWRWQPVEKALESLTEAEVMDLATNAMTLGHVGLVLISILMHIPGSKALEEGDTKWWHLSLTPSCGFTCEEKIST